MDGRRMHCMFLLLVVLSPLAVAEQQREGVEIRAIEEQPRALHLVSWRAPPPAMDHAPKVDDERTERLLKPLDDRRFLQHLGFRQTLRLQLNDNDE